MQLKEVRTRADEKEFVEINAELNKQYSTYIRPMDHEIMAVFNPEKNKAFRHGECIRWILQDDEGKSIGRIAAFANKKYKNKGDEQPVGGIGFFDCINNQDAADMLFDVAKHWLMQKGMGAMDGPINFGERDKWWGLLTEGFHEPLYGMNYNPPYYKELFEHYGFKVFFNQVCFGLNPKSQLSEKLKARHDAVVRDPAFRAITAKKSQLKKYAQDFTTVYNKAYAGHGGMKELRFEQVNAMFRTMKPVMDENIVWFTYWNDEPIALFINLPDLNQWFKYLNGKFTLWHKLKFLWIKKTKANPTFVGIVFAIVPEFQGKGIDSFMIRESQKVIMNLDYKICEMQWVGDFNPKMLNMISNIGDTYKTRELATYRYLFDQTREFKRHPYLN